MPPQPTASYPACNVTQQQLVSVVFARLSALASSLHDRGPPLCVGIVTGTHESLESSHLPWSPLTAEAVAIGSITDAGMQAPVLEKEGRGLILIPAAVCCRGTRQLLPHCSVGGRHYLSAISTAQSYQNDRLIQLRLFSAPGRCRRAVTGPAIARTGGLDGAYQLLKGFETRVTRAASHN